MNQSKGSSIVTKRKILTFFVLYALMLLLWLFGYEMTKVTPATKVESLNSFECPADGQIRNQYDCSRFDLEKNPHYAFSFGEGSYNLFDLTIYMRVYRQTGLQFNEDRTENVIATLYKLTLDSTGEVTKEEVEKYNLKFDCRANEWMCQPQTIISEKNYPSGRHNFLFEFENPQNLFKTIKHIDLYMEHYDQSYQAHVLSAKFYMLVLALIGTVGYYFFIKRNGLANATTEQQLVLGLSVIVLCLNDPLMFLYYSSGTTLFMLISKVLIGVFLSAIIPLIIALIRTLRYGGQGRYFTFPEVLFGVANVAVTLICCVFVPDQPSMFFKLFRIFNGIGGIWILVGMVQNLLAWKSLTWIDNVFMLVTFYFAGAYLKLVRGWETPIDVHNRNYSKELALIYLFTIYLLMCQYLFIVPKDEKDESPKATIGQKEKYAQLGEDVERSDYTDS